MKKSNKSFVSLVLSVLIIASSLFLGSAAKMDPLLQNASVITLKLFNFDKSNDEKYTGNIFSYYLNGVDGVQDYIISEGEDGGYAIYTKSDLKLIEYSEDTSPFHKKSKGSCFYGGPANYFIGVGDELQNIKSQRKFKKSLAVSYADEVDKILNDNKLNEVLEQEDITTSTNLNNAIISKEEIIDSDNYIVTSKDIITYGNFFVENTYHGKNMIGTCGSVAAQLMLSYANWCCCGGLIANNFLHANRNEKLEMPYSMEMIYTTSDDLCSDNSLSFYELLKSYINPDALSPDHEDFDIRETCSGATIYEVKSGMEEYLEDYATNLVDVLEFDVVNNNVENKINFEISQNRPSLALISYLENGETKWHFIIIYGRQSIIDGNEIIEGYIANFGWGKGSTKLWFNSSFVEKIITMGSNHVHSDVVYEGNSHILQCQSCGRIVPTDAHSFGNSAGSIYISDSVDASVFHTAICSCGYKKTFRHQFDTFVNPNEVYHNSTCSACGYYKQEFHLYKADAEHCFYCGYNRLGV